MSKFTQKVTNQLLTKGLAECEHCGLSQTHSTLGENGTCNGCHKEVREGLF